MVTHQSGPQTNIDWGLRPGGEGRVDPSLDPPLCGTDSTSTGRLSNFAKRACNADVTSRHTFR